MAEPIGEKIIAIGGHFGSARIVDASGLNQTEDDWRTLVELAPESCWAIEIDGKLAATTTLLCYGRRLGWIEWY